MGSYSIRSVNIFTQKDVNDLLKGQQPAKKETKGTVRYNVGGKEYTIPKEEIDEFLKEFPNAIKL